MTIYVVDHYNRGMARLVYFTTWDDAETWRAKNAPHHYIVPLEFAEVTA